MLADVIPLVIKLEIAKGAPFVDISLSELREKRQSPSPQPFRTMQPKRRNKKNSTRSETSAGAPLAPPVKPQSAESSNNNVVLDKDACMGQRKYSEVVVESIKPTAVPPSLNLHGVVTSASQSSVSTVSLAQSVSENVPEKISYYCGNPSVEKTTGLLHFYKQNGTDIILDEEVNMLCMLGVPATVSCQDVVDFVTPMMDKIAEMKIIRDATPNQFMVLLKMKSHESACTFYTEYNGAPFCTFDKETVCRLVFVERVESISSDDGGSLPFTSLTELPTCAVCLERMDDDVLTILCNHSFHAKCLKQWDDFTCPVCRYLQTPEITKEQTCSDCDKTTDLWMCLICGNIGCGRYAEAHAYQHFLKTQHTFTIELGGEKVWDYAGDNYVHRLIQVGQTGNKMAEVGGCGREDVKGKDQVEAALQVEYTCLLTSQLETQRRFYEEKLRKVEEAHKVDETGLQKALDELNLSVEEAQSENDVLKRMLKEAAHEKATLDKKNQQMTVRMDKLQEIIREERAVSTSLRHDVTELHNLCKKQAVENCEARERWTKRAYELQEQIDDLMNHFQAAQKIREQLGDEDCAGASVHVENPKLPSTSKTTFKADAKRKGGRKK